MQPDPIGLKAAKARRPGSLNRYSYVMGDPVNYLDTAGTDIQCWGSFLIEDGIITAFFGISFCIAEPELDNLPQPIIIGGQDPYNGLTQDEKILCLAYPYVCSQVNRARNDALQERQTRYGATGPNDDWCDNAFLHAYWNARMVQLMSSLPSEHFYPGFTAVEIAKAFADAHEARPNNPAEEKEMDFWNNSVGRIIATQNPTATPEQLAVLIQREVSEGRVLVMDGDRQTPRHPRPGECDPND